MSSYAETLVEWLIVHKPDELAKLITSLPKDGDELSKALFDGLKALLADCNDFVDDATYSGRTYKLVPSKIPHDMQMKLLEDMAEGIAVERWWAGVKPLLVSFIGMILGA